ncbi:MAG: hypothetical protein DWQ01_17920 [Planctomycetota bacterium]|nr:MAG: hypothetical protein DWQ01_17920 [Planctomycetota bacterium]
MKTHHVLLAVLMLPGAALAQQDGTVNTVDTSTQVFPATQGDEGPLRFESQVPKDRSSYLPAPMPQVSGIHTGPQQAISYDMISGEELVYDAPSTGLSHGWVVGRELADQVGESISRSFPGLSAVTSTSFPWSTHCRMWFTKFGLNYVCSGTLIDARTMMTAGHCVHEGSGGNWATNVSVAPSWDGDDDAFGSANGISLGSWTSWTVSGSYDGDMGWVRLDRPIGVLTGWLGYGYNSDNSWWSSAGFNLTGYPGSCFSGAPDQFYYDYGTWDSVGTYVVEADMSESCWIGGMSGGGIYYIDGSGNRYVYADVSHGWGWPSSTTRMGACRMTSSKFDWVLNTFIPGAYNTSQVDYIPLDMEVDMGGSSMRAGTAPSSMSYRVFNNSLYNPASATVHTDTYLSTNDNISEFDTLIQSHTFTWDFGAKSSVTVNYSTPPTIPVDTVPGSYWIGVIIDELDYSTSNNDTDGWDAAPVTIIEPLNSITLSGPSSGAVGSTVTYDISDAPTSAPVWMYWSRTLGGTTINGHPFAIGSPYNTVASGTTSSTGTWTVSGTIPPALAGRTIWLEIRADKYGYTYDSYVKGLTGF